MVDLPEPLEPHWRTKAPSKAACEAALALASDDDAAADRAAMQDRPMADRDIRPDRQREPRIGMKDAAVLDVRVPADRDRLGQVLDNLVSNVDENTTTVTFMDPFAATPAVFAAMQTFNGSDPSDARLGPVNTSGFGGLLQLSAWTGVYGLSFLLVGVSSLVAHHRADFVSFPPDDLASFRATVSADRSAPATFTDCTAPNDSPRNPVTSSVVCRAAMR